MRAGTRYGGIGRYDDLPEKLSHNSSYAATHAKNAGRFDACVTFPTPCQMQFFPTRVACPPCIESSCTFRMNRTLISLLISSQLQLKPRAHPYPFAKFVKEDWNRAHCQRNKCQKRVPPAQTEGSVHRRACKWQDGTNERAQDCIRSQCGCSM